MWHLSGQESEGRDQHTYGMGGGQQKRPVEPLVSHHDARALCPETFFLSWQVTCFSQSCQRNTCDP